MISTRQSTYAFHRCIATVALVLAASPPGYAEQLGARYAPLTEADVERVITTLAELIETAEARNTALLSDNIEQRGFAAELLWNVETAIAAIDQTDPEQSSTLLGFLAANGFDAKPDEVISMWRHYANRVLEADDANQLATQNRDLGTEWTELERQMKSDGPDAHIDSYTELDYVTRVALYTARDREPVLAHADKLQKLRARVASWPREQ